MATILSKLGATKQECEQFTKNALQFLKDIGQPTAVENDGIPLRVALFGQYNSGKSTLVNALFKQRVALTGDAPETKIAHIYNIQGYEIADLPGGDARLQESEEALQALRSAHAVLYIVSSVTGFDYETLWVDLLLLMRRGIPFVVVVNDKKPHQDEQSERDFRQQIESHFREIASRRLADQDWTNRLFWIRASAAERGRIEGKEGLIKSSGIVPLEFALLEILQKSEAPLRDAARIRKIQEALSSVRRKLESSEEAVSLRGIEDALKHCESTRLRLDAEARLITDEGSFSSLRDNISAKLNRSFACGASNKSDVQEEIRLFLNETYIGAITTFKSHCEAAFADLKAAVDRDIQYDKSSKAIAPAIPLADVPMADVPMADPKGIDIAAALPRAVANATALMDIVKIADKQSLIPTVEAVGKVAAKESAVAAEASAKGAVEAAGGWAKYLGHAIIILTTAWEIWDGFRAATREKDAHIAAVREFDAKADLAARAAKQQFLAEASKIVALALSPIEREFRKELKKRSRDASDIASRLLSVAELTERSALIISELNMSSVR